MSGYLFLPVVAFSLFVVEWLFLAFAQRKHIYDDPNDRSSHTHKTIRGGGVIFWFASLAIFIWSPAEYWLYFAGMTLVSAISFTDDIHNLGQWPRFISHVAGFTLMFFFLHFFGAHWYIILITYIVFIGVLNAWNFMDGINGINGLYSLAVLGALQYVNIDVAHFTDQLFIWTPMVACLVFLFFNFRKKALCFGGDVGSIAIAFWIVTLLLALMIKTHNVIWLAFISVYGIDSVFTILHRLWLRQNIFEAHRLHFYQVLANECSIDHRIVSTIYAIAQVLVCAVVIVFWNKMNFWLLAFALHIPLGAVYMNKFLIKKDKR
jgi:UDP-N-acetylmuramyl pentapeptide phosphotransferase/UDP-N-acetylglucosamine-1-phosphate transferase